ncbi:MAG: hypothetical protein NT062_17575 [Proteobacteria bacterium]|nr:hypothetical protein [Pseudomonadota bacterium]
MMQARRARTRADRKTIELDPAYLQTMAEESRFAEGTIPPATAPQHPRTLAVVQPSEIVESTDSADEFDERSTMPIAIMHLTEALAPAWFRAPTAHPIERTPALFAPEHLARRTPISTTAWSAAAIAAVVLALVALAM